MTTATSGELVPEWDVADRMRKALRISGIGVQQMAEYLDVSRVTAGNWINGHHTPSTQTLRLWAMKCGVSFEWLRDGTPVMRPDDRTPLEPPVGFEPTTYRLGVRDSSECRVIQLPARLHLVGDELRKTAA